MGGHYGSIQVRGGDREKLCAVLAEIVGSKRKFLVGPSLSGWIGAYPNEGGQSPAVAAAVAERLPNDILYLGVHDDDILFYEFYKEGRLVDSYCSDPDYFGEVSASERERLKGRPDVFDGILNAAAIGDLRTLLEKGYETFMSERLAELAKILAIENAVTSYEYLKDGELDGIVGWERFIEIPEPKIAAQKKRALRKQLELEWRVLRERGVLIASTRLGALPPRRRPTDLASVLPLLSPSTGGIVIVDEKRSLIAVSGGTDGLTLFDANTRAVVRRLRMPRPETIDERLQQWVEYNLELASNRGDDLSVSMLEAMRTGAGHPQIDAIRRTLAANQRNERVFAMQLDLEEDRLVVGTSFGLRIYRWSDVIHSSDSLPAPVRYDSFNYCYDLVIDGQRILCGDLAGRLLSLEPHGMRVLVTLPGRFSVFQLALDSKERRLSVWLHERYDHERRGSQKPESRLVEFDLDRLSAQA